MNEINEYKVKPVIRWNLTHYQSRDVGHGLRNASVRSLGEFDSEQQAEETKSMYEAVKCISHTRIVQAQEVRGPRGTYYFADGRVLRAYDQGALGLEPVVAVEYQDPQSPDDSGRLFTLEKSAFGTVWAEIEVGP